MQSELEQSGLKICIVILDDDDLMTEVTLQSLRDCTETGKYDLVRLPYDTADPASKQGSSYNTIIVLDSYMLITGDLLSFAESAEENVVNVRSSELVLPVIMWTPECNPVNSSYLDHSDMYWSCAERAGALEQLLARVRNYEYRNYAAMQLPGREIEYRRTAEGTARYLGSTYMGTFEKDFFVIRNITVREGVLCIEGACGYYGATEAKAIEVTVVNGSNESKASVTYRDHRRAKGISMRTATFRGYIKLNADESNRISIKLRLGELDLKSPAFNNFDLFSPLSGRFRNEYSVQGGFVIGAAGGYLTAEALPSFMPYAYIKQKEKLLMKELKTEAVPNYRYIKKLRSRAIRTRLHKKRPVWIICDRPDAADDNGEAIFRYVSRNMSDRIDAYYAIRRESRDYERLRGYGRVVDFGSEEHKQLMLAADAVISSQSFEIIRNPFGRESYAFRDLLHAPFIVAEHGVSYGKDFHTWFNRSNRMLDLLLVASDKEYLDFTKPCYEYLEDEVAAVGLPRFDYLENHTEKLITIMPSWRKSLTEGWDNERGRWIISENVEGSEFISFYKTLLTDERLKSAMDKYGYRIQVKLHPIIKECEKSFGPECADCFTESNRSYKDVFARSSLVVTDFSSVMYDFAYLGKPVIYCHFDMESVNRNHTFTWNEDFTYESDGFGEIETELTGTVDRLIEYMKNGCALKPEYRRRVEEFFPAIDRNNSERAVNAIMKKLNQLI